MVEFYLGVFLVLAGAWAVGEAAHRFGQAPLVGQLPGGVLLGPAILDLVQPTSNLTVLENVGLFFIMLLTGMTVKPREITAAHAAKIPSSMTYFLLATSIRFLVKTIP